ncbi:UNVERIFIED_CONTAM: hypothetical protein FKN15_022630 [Acipenser sinensis]
MTNRSDSGVQIPVVSVEEVSIILAWWMGCIIEPSGLSMADLMLKETVSLPE